MGSSPPLLEPSSDDEPSTGAVLPPSELELSELDAVVVVALVDIDVDAVIGSVPLLLSPVVASLPSSFELLPQATSRSRAADDRDVQRIRGCYHPGRGRHRCGSCGTTPTR